MKLHQLAPTRGSRRSKMTVGRGNGSKKGTYSGRGGKGQTARTGGVRRPGFEGGQTPLTRRMPKLGGFKNPRRIEYSAVNLGTLNRRYKSGETVDRATLIEKKILPPKNTQPIKILGDGALEISLTFDVDGFSKSATAKIEKAGGTLSKGPTKNTKKKKAPLTNVRSA